MLREKGSVSDATKALPWESTRRRRPQRYRSRSAVVYSMASGESGDGGDSMDAPLAFESAIESPEHQESLTLPSDDLAPRAARTFTRKTLADWGLDELADRALLIVSELATNARRHGRTKSEGEVELITLTLAVQNGVMGIELQDNSTLPPIPRADGLDALDGRGLLLVAAEADAWTARLNEDGSGKKVLAFLVRRPSASAV
ncbi:ATP-binding protein [Streptomyces nigrescens]|uniref:ATP-binding protein n=2 Tax=Streptomyces nigrescens TaxID=1920 RepID=A0ABY7IQS8_STRNI|nr:ATP-binding protein [Streptomyces libani]WAU00036.1 ATP-binding protein [Streptomyces libani subsp. libani]